ncbi:MAG: HDOD domain-containing protein [Verrucomicrobiae bacterium]|nr:HDOD domain-containing protein [Verrucomicrobiae bacterium]
MGAELIEQILKKVNTLPPLPAAVQKLTEMTKDTETSYDEMAEVISTDEMLTSRILRVANSPFYGLAQRVSTVSQAIVVLGMQGVKSIAIGVSVFGFKAGSGNTEFLKREDLWRHALGVATGAKLLATHFELENWEEAFVGGMLHDIGKIILMECFSAQYSEVLKAASTGAKSLQQLEQEAFGINHSNLGAEICRRWKMPASLARMISMHHVNARTSENSIKLDHILFAVRIADNLARIAKIGNDGDPQLAADFMPLVEAENLKPEQLRRILLMLPEEVEKVEVFFDLTPSVHPHPDDLAAKQVGVIIDDSRDQEIIRICLLAMGYTLALPLEILDSQKPLAGAIVDGALDPEMRKNLESRQIPIADFGLWRQENAPVDQTVQININLLQDWLAKILPKVGQN